MAKIVGLLTMGGLGLQQNLRFFQLSFELVLVCHVLLSLLGFLLNVVQQARAAAHAAGEPAADGAEGAPVLNTAFVEGVRKFAMNVKELDIDLIDSINPFGQAYAILAKSMSESSLKAVADVIASKKTPLSMEDARELSRRALQFKTERGRLPSATSQDPWERKLAEAVAFLAQKKAEAARGK